MAKTLNESAITTRSARASLPPGLHWRGIDPEVHLGYRKGRRGGVWLVRWRDGSGYRQTGIGTADDVITEGTLDFAAATKIGRETVEHARAKSVALAAGPVPTVSQALEAYVAGRDARETRRAGRVVRSDASRRLGRHVLGAAARGNKEEVAPAKLADISLQELSEADLKAWLGSLPDTLKDTTTRRLVNDVKAALNAAYSEFRERLNPRLPEIIKNGLRLETGDDEVNPVARDSQILSDNEVSRLLKAAREIDREQEWDGDLFRLVLVLAATGARFSQIARMKVADCQIDAQRLLVPVSRKGRGGRSGSIAVPVGGDVLGELVSAIDGRDTGAFLLERWRFEQVPGGTKWIRNRRGRWRTSSELTRPWKSIRERAGLPETIPYSLRHSSIVRGIRANLPIRLVAAMHDTSVAMVERHYAKWIVDGLESLVRGAIVPMVLDAESKTQLHKNRT